MIKTTVLQVFDSMTDDALTFGMDYQELQNLCNALSLDIQALKENSPKHSC